jgi:hypothetical protein
MSPAAGATAFVGDVFCGMTSSRILALGAPFRASAARHSLARRLTLFTLLSSSPAKP